MMIPQESIDTIQISWLARYKHGHVLHVGCGEKYWPGCVNIDPNPDRPKVDFRYDVHELPFQGGQFDAVLSCHVLPALWDIRLAMSEMTRVLRFGGIMAHVVPDNRVAPMRHNKRYPWDFQRQNWLGPDHFRRDFETWQIPGLELALCRNFGDFDFSFQVLCVRV